MTATNTTATLAAEFGTDARTLRKFLRSDLSSIDSVGKGARYTLPATKREVSALRKGFLAWGEQVVEAKAQREAAKATASEAPEVDEVTDEVLDEVDPTDDEILAIDDEV